MKSYIYRILSSYPTRRALLENLVPSDISSLGCAVQLSMSTTERNTFLAFQRELPLWSSWIDQQIELGNSVLMLGTDVRLLRDMIVHPMEFWNHHTRPTHIAVWIAAVEKSVREACLSESQGVRQAVTYWTDKDTHVSTPCGAIDGEWPSFHYPPDAQQMYNSWKATRLPGWPNIGGPGVNPADTIMLDSPNVAIRSNSRYCEGSLMVVPSGLCWDKRMNGTHYPWKAELGDASGRTVALFYARNELLNFNELYRLRSRLVVSLERSPGPNTDVSTRSPGDALLGDVVQGYRRGPLTYAILSNRDMKTFSSLPESGPRYVCTGRPAITVTDGFRTYLVPVPC